MNIRDGFIGMVGNTPLIKLRRPSEETGCTILGKAEFLNPGGSVKDRAALFIIKDAEERGLLRPGGVIVEGTAGNTGIGLALVGNARGYRTVIVMPETQSQEKKDMLLLCGVDLRLVPAVPYANPMHYARYSGRLAEEIAAGEPNGAIWANQFDNVANRDGHYRTTGPEIWEDTDGQVDILISGVGTGGTITGVTEYIRARKPSFKAIAVEPKESAVLSGGTPSPHKIQGIGAGFIPEILRTDYISEVIQVSSEEALVMARRLAKEEGLLMGISSGAAVVAAIQLAQRPDNAGKLIVTVLPDFGERYLSSVLFDHLRKESTEMTAVAI